MTKLPQVSHERVVRALKQILDAADISPERFKDLL
jgi:hypothetical protein